MEPKIIARGRPASPGFVSGKVRVLVDLDELPNIGVGEILVVKTSNPAWVVGMMNSSALISEVGGIISHAAIVAREFGIPCVVAVENASKIFKTGQMVKVDGDKGIIYEG